MAQRAGLEHITVEMPYENEEPAPFPFDKLRTGGTPPREGIVTQCFWIPLLGRGGRRPGWVLRCFNRENVLAGREASTRPLIV